MFTGIVETKGRVTRVEPNEFGVRLSVDPGGWSRTVNAGDSICVSGCCLTHAPGDNAAGDGLAFDVIQETLQKTNLGDLKEGDAVNLEASLTPTTPMGGHFVQGHIDGTGRITDVKRGADEWRVRVELDAGLMQYVVPKGSVAIDGVSLTVAALDASAGTFEVALIPTTLEITTLGQAKAGDTVNIEADLITKAVVHTVRNMSGDAAGLTMQTLRDAGFAE